MRDVTKAGTDFGVLLGSYTWREPDIAVEVRNQGKVRMTDK